MNNQDPIADMLTRLRNANRVGRRQVLIPKSKICTGIAHVLRDEGYIDEFDEIADDRQGQIRVKLKYGVNGDKIIHAIDRAVVRDLAVAAASGRGRRSVGALAGRGVDAPLRRIRVPPASVG